MKRIATFLFMTVLFFQPFVGAERKQAYPEALHAGLNDQLKMEFESAYFYLAVSDHFDDLGLNGFASWFMKQSEEEMGHMKKVLGFLQDIDLPVKFPTLVGPEVHFSSPLEAFQKSFENEQRLTVHLLELYDLAMQTKEYRLLGLLDWFLTEQIEEEDLFLNLIRRLELIEGDTGAALLLLDQELGAR